MISRWFEPGNRKLRDRVVVIFDFHLEIVVRQDAFTERQDLRHFAGIEPVVSVVVTHPELQYTAFRLPNRASTVDKVLRIVPDLSQVEMGRDLITVRQDKAGEFVWVNSESTSTRSIS